MFNLIPSERLLLGQKALAGRDPNKVRDRAGDVGSLVHFIIECLLLSEMNGEKVEPDLSEFAPADVKEARKRVIESVVKSVKGKKQSPEHIKKRIKSRHKNKNYVLSEEQKNRLRTINIGRNPIHISSQLIIAYKYSI